MSLASAFGGAESSRDCMKFHLLGTLYRYARWEQFLTYPAMSQSLRHFGAPILIWIRTMKGGKLRSTPEDTYLRRAAEYGRGMRILRQDLWEILISFLISQNNNIPRIRTSLNALCALTQGRFPEPQEVAALENATLRELGLGYRAEYVRDTAEYYARHPMELEMLHSMETGEVKEALLEREGIAPQGGEAVSACTCACAPDGFVSHGYPYETGGGTLLSRGIPFLLALRGVCGADAAISLLLSS